MGRVGGLGLLTVSILLASLGCGSGPPPDTEVDQPSAPVPSVRDSAGILITETAEAIAIGPVDWEVDSAPVLELGSEEVLAEVFSGVRGLRGLPEGGVLVVDAVSRELRFFDSSGDLVHKVGRKGEGPGEFQSPFLLQNHRSDSLLVWDGRLKRLQKFSEAGEQPRTITLRRMWPSGTLPPLGGIGPLLLVFIYRRCPALPRFGLRGPSLCRASSSGWILPRGWRCLLSHFGRPLAMCYRADLVRADDSWFRSQLIHRPPFLALQLWLRTGLIQRSGNMVWTECFVASSADESRCSRSPHPMHNIYMASSVNSAHG